MAAVDVVRAHYDRYLGDGRPSMPIPEWTEPGSAEPFMVYWRPVTLRDKGACFQDDKPEGWSIVKLICRKAEGRDGKPLFDELKDHAVLFDHADQTVLARIAKQMLAAPSVQDLAVKLSADADRMNQFWIADKLGKTIAEIEAMTVAEFNETKAYYVSRQNAP